MTVADVATVADVVALRGRYHDALLRTAARYVGSHALAEEVVQDTWLGALVGLRRFEARSSLKTWVFRILENTAKNTARREARATPVASVEASVETETEPEVRRPPVETDTPEARLLLAELRETMGQAIATLPPRERAVLTLRLQGATPREICTWLRISEANQRVTLHRARSKLLARLRAYRGGEA